MQALEAIGLREMRLAMGRVSLFNQVSPKSHRSRTFSEHSMFGSIMSAMTEKPLAIRFIETAVFTDLEVLETKVQPTADNEDSHVRIKLKVEEDLLETSAFALIFAFGALSFHDGRPRGFSGELFEEKDEWKVSDMLERLEYRNGDLYFYADYVRGRCLKTTIELSADGILLLETVNRGEAATRWVSKLQGEKTLRVVAK